MKRCVAVTAFCFLASPCQAQKIVNSPVVWLGAFGDHRFGAKSSFYWDTQIRRADAGLIWQQLLGTVGYTRDLSPQWRATVATEFTHGYRYGPFPAHANSIEFRPWLQIAGTRKVDGWTWSDRSRVELRMIKPVGEFAPADADFQTTVVRLRRQDRVQHALNGKADWYGAGSSEFFVNVSPAGARVAMLEQIRAQALIGHQLSAHNRAEAGYGMQLFNRHGGYELNHILLLFFRTTVPLT